MSFFHKKRFYLILLCMILILLFYKTNWLERMIYPIRYKEYIEESSKTHQLDPYLISSVIRVESNFNPKKVSKKNAQGLMQLMPQTANWIAEQNQIKWLEEEALFDPDVNVKLGSWFLAHISQLLQEDTEKLEKYDQIAVIAGAYNAGPANIQKWLTEKRWDGTVANIANIPYGETRHYIQRVLYYYKKYEEIYRDEWPETEE